MDVKVLRLDPHDPCLHCFLLDSIQLWRLLHTDVEAADWLQSLIQLCAEELAMSYIDPTEAAKIFAENLLICLPLAVKNVAEAHIEAAAHEAQNATKM